MDSEKGKLFIGGISSETTEEGLKEYFRMFGDVLEAEVKKDRITGRGRGFGFVLFADPAVAERVLQERHSIDGRTVEAKRAFLREKQHSISNGSQILREKQHSISNGSQIRTKKIFVGGLAPAVTQNDMIKYFEQFGTITDAVVMYDSITQAPRGFGFIVYDSEDAVHIAVQNPFHHLNGKTVEVKRAIPKELSRGQVRLPAGAGAYGGNNFIASNCHGFNSTPAPPLSTSYGNSSYGPAGYDAPGFGMSVPGYRPASSGAAGGYDSTTFGNNIPSNGSSSSYGGAPFSYGGPVAYGGAPFSYGGPVGYGGQGSESEGMNQYGARQVDNGSSDGCAAQNNGYGMGVPPYTST